MPVVVETMRLAGRDPMARNTRSNGSTRSPSGVCMRKACRRLWSLPMNSLTVVFHANFTPSFTAKLYSASMAGISACVLR